MSVDVAQFLQVFLEEAAEHLGTLETSLLELERTPRDAELLGKLFRAAHSIKGGAATFGLPAVARFTHHAESLLDAMREGAVVATAETVDLLLQATDLLRTMLVGGGGDAEGPRADQLVAALQAALVGGGAAVPAPAAVVAAPAGRRIHVHFVPARDILQSGLDPLTLIRELASVGVLEDVELDATRVPDLAELDPCAVTVGWRFLVRADDGGSLTPEQVREVFEFASMDAELDVEAEAEAQDPGAGAAHATSDPQAPTAGTPAAARAADGSIRVAVGKVDELVNLVGELVINQSMVGELVRGFRIEKLGQLIEAVAAMERNTRELQERVMGIRMVPVGSVFQRFPRMVRDLGASLGRKVDLVLIGEDTELDKGVVERLADPLTHLVRNAVDHGIESPAARVAAGKPEVGSLRLTAAHQGGHVIIELRDDGHGLDTARIRAKALAQGLIGPHEDLSEAAIHNLIFAAGFSTAAVVTDISGRGVGLDVVRRNIEALEGTVAIESVAGQGTCFRIVLPLTLAILDGLSLRVGEQIYVLPLTSIIESLRVRPEQYRRVLGRGELIDLRGESIPLLRLHHVFSIDVEAFSPVGRLVVIVEHQGAKMGLLVDEITGQPQVVIKSLESNYRRVDGVMGATILGDGHVALILDVPGLIRTGHDLGKRITAARAQQGALS